jgi:biotin carboxylase
MKGEQVTVDGFVDRGEVSIMGIVDSVMFEGTQTFERFEYPSRLPADVQERMVELTRRMVAGFGFASGQFNVELFWDRETDAISVIEINPRLSYQFADLYEYVDGSNTYDVLLDLTLGRTPAFRRRGGEFAVCASFVLRAFQGKKLAAVPSPAHVDAFAKQYEEATVKIYGKAGTSMKGEMRASGSYRYAIINVAAQSHLDLFAIHQDAIDKLPFQVR